MTKAATKRAAFIAQSQTVVIGSLHRSKELWHGLLGFDQQVLQIQKDGLINCLVGVGSGHATLTLTARTTYPVDIVFDVTWHVVVYNVLDLREVQTFTGNVCGYQHVLLALSESFDGLGTLFLIFASVNGHCFDT